MSTIVTKVRRQSNNETIKLYDDMTVKHVYDGFPAMGIVEYDIEGFTVSVDDEDDELDSYREEVREFVEKALFTEHTFRDAEVYVKARNSNTLVVDEYSEDNTYVVELDKTNKTRLE